ncbi:DNA cytosine methyltransferase [Bdellovibrio sp. HCB288]|uniref:DNA cytosine methyltransferase n=1 Tax=Bdellovibrio sp. HCB288 TaxID=3394355 RepID=UPI0039B4CDCE
MSASSSGNSYRVLDLFAGAGGFSLGFDWAGFSTSVAIDFNQNAIDTLVGNYSDKKTVVLKEDLSKLTPFQLEHKLSKENIRINFDVIIGGPPCQGWSMAGRGKIRSLTKDSGPQGPLEDPRNKLYKRYLAYVRHFQPKVAVMENVSGMLSHSGINIADLVAETFEDAGYRVTWKKVNASEFGVPQSRERLFFVGIRKDLNLQFRFPETILKNGQFKYPTATVKDAISDLPAITHGSKDWIKNYIKQTGTSDYAKLMRKDAVPGKIFDHVCRGHNEQDLAAFKHMKQGDLYKDLPAHLKRYRDDIFHDKYRKLRWSKPSGCVTAHLSKDCYSHIHPSQTRTISVREAARLQSFPDSFYFAGSMSSKFQLIGNAVPPLVAFRIATEIKKQIFSIQRKSKATSFQEVEL